MPAHQGTISRCSPSICSHQMCCPFVIDPVSKFNDQVPGKILDPSKTSRAMLVIGEKHKATHGVSKQNVLM